MKLSIRTILALLQCATYAKSALMPLLRGGNPVSCNWQNQCPAGSLCDTRPEFFKDPHCYLFQDNSKKIGSTESSSSKGKSIESTVNAGQCPKPHQVSTCQACKTVGDCPVGFVCCNNGKSMTCTAPVHSPDARATVVPLLMGSFVELSKSPLILEMNASVTLITVQKRHVLVDTGSPAMKDRLLETLEMMQIKPSEISMTITTHGHPDHYGNMNLFPSVHTYGSYKMLGNLFIANPLQTKERYFLCTKNVYLLRTPGHTPEDITVVVDNAEHLGTVAVTGDLFFSEQDMREPSLWQQMSWNSTLQLHNRRRVACLADYIIPGHGKMFKVTMSVRNYFQCGYKTQ